MTIENYDECVDGLTMFLGQGRIALDAARYDDRFVLDVYKRRADFEDCDTFLNISHISGNVLDEFEHDTREVYETRDALFARVSGLLLQHNPF
jgi:hypothetical protein